MLANGTSNGQVLATGQQEPVDDSETVCKFCTQAVRNISQATADVCNILCGKKPTQRHDIPASTYHANP